MDVGLFNLMGYRTPGRPTAAIYDAAVAQVKAAEQAGFSIAWFAEHHFSNYCVCPSPLMMVARLAGETSRIRLASGLSLQGVDKPNHISDGLAAAAGPEQYYEPPLINVITFACNACKDNEYEVTNTCQGCLAHPCREICPKGAISFVNKKAFIDQEKCIHCGLCAKTCPYQAIHHYVRPCAEACGMNAIGSDDMAHLVTIRDLDEMEPPC